jgi:GWxTD domain-containing protein
MIKFLHEHDSVSSEIQINDDPSRIEFNQNQIVHLELETPIPDSIIINSKLIAKRSDQSIAVKNEIYRYYNTAKYLIFTERIERDFLEEGRYELVYEIDYNNQKYEITKDFEVVWFEKPIYLYKFDLALRPMRYILSENEQEEVDGLSYGEQEIWFNNYWSMRDPTENTPINEIQYEFFNRVDEANRKYSQRFKEGWETDRGRALILYGKPDRMETHRYVTTTKPYEIWFYDTLKQKLTFVDVNKDNNYPLVSIEKIGDTKNEPNE